jgi:hypothetical protein
MEADYLILADGAQVANDKLYLLGGGWLAVTAQQYPVNHSMAIAIGILVEWMETNRQHSFKLEVRQEDNQNRVVASVEGAFEQGRAAGIPAGSTQRIQMAMPMTIPLAAPGEYVVRLLLNGREAKKAAFTARTTQLPPLSAALPATDQ